MRLFRVAQFAAAPLRRTAVALRPPSANSNQYCQNHPRHSNRQPPVCDANPHLVRWHDATYCSSKNCAGRSLCPAEARNSHSLVCGLRRLPPAPRHVIPTANLPFAIPILALRLGGMTSVCAMRETAPLCGVIFGGSRKARPPQPPKINFAQAHLNKPQTSLVLYSAYSYLWLRLRYFVSAMLK